MILIDTDPKVSLTPHQSADDKESIIKYKRITHLILSIIYFVAFLFLLLSLFGPYCRSRYNAKKSVKTVLRTQVRSYGFNLATSVSSVMNKFGVILTFLKNMDKNNYIKCSDASIYQLVKYIRTVAQNNIPLPYAIFDTTVFPNSDRRYCQFVFEDNDPTTFSLSYLFESGSNSIRDVYNHQTDFQDPNWRDQRISTTTYPLSQFNFSMIHYYDTNIRWMNFPSYTGNESHKFYEQISVVSANENSDGVFSSLMGITFFTEQFLKILQHTACPIKSAYQTVFSEKNSTLYQANISTKYAFLQADTNAVIIEDKIGVVPQLYQTKKMIPVYPKLDQLNSSFWVTLSPILYSHKLNEIFEFNYNGFDFIVTAIGVNPFNVGFNALSETSFAPDFHSLPQYNVTHYFVVCAPIDPSIEEIYRNISLSFVIGIVLILALIILLLFLLKKEKKWKAKKLKKQTLFTKKTEINLLSPNTTKEEPEIDKVGEFVSFDDGLINHSIQKVRDLQLLYPEDAILNRTLDLVVDNLTTRENGKYVLKHPKCEFCKYLTPKEVQFQDEKKKSVSHHSKGKTRQKTQDDENESDESMDDDEGEEADDCYRYNKANLNVNYYSKDIQPSYMVWHKLTYPSLKFNFAARRNSIRDRPQSTSFFFEGFTNETNRKKYDINWERFSLDPFIPDPNRMVVRYMMTILSDTDVIIPPFDPMYLLRLLLIAGNGIQNKIHIAHTLFAAHQLVFGPLSYWLNNKLDILVLAFAIYFLHFDAKLYHRNINSNQNLNNENDGQMTLHESEVFSDDLTRIEGNISELKKLIFTIIPYKNGVRNPLIDTNTYDEASLGLDSTINSSMTEIDDYSPTETSMSSFLPPPIPSPKGKGPRMVPPSQQPISKQTGEYTSIDTSGPPSVKINKARSKDTIELETDTETVETTETVTSLALTKDPMDSASMSRTRRSSLSLTDRNDFLFQKKQREINRKKKKKKTPFWYFWRTLKRVLYIVMDNQQSLEFVGQMRSRIQSPNFDVQDDYEDKVLFIASLIKLCDYAPYWSPQSLMKKSLDINNQFIFTPEELANPEFVPAYHLEFAQKIVMPWIQVFSTFKSFGDVVENATRVIDHFIDLKNSLGNGSASSDTPLIDLASTLNKTSYTDNDDIEIIDYDDKDEYD